MSVLPESALPSKLFFRIGEVASLVGVEPHVLRYWEREFRSIRPTKSAKGQRVYSRKDVENLLRVRDLLYRDGFTIAGAKKRLQRGSEPETAGDRVEEPEREREGNVQHAHDVQDEEELAAEPQSGPRSHDGEEPSVRGKLTALRAEVEGFLDELDSERV
jgi:DNA-binding transcriptional MerR regulator